MEISLIFNIDVIPNSESDVEPISDVCELQHNSQESHVSCHSIRHDDMLLPFPNHSRSWCVKEQKIHKSTYDTLRRLNPTERDGANAILCMNQSRVQGSLKKI